jgi:hypothetical protein
MQTSTLRPGLLVAVTTSIRGNIRYWTTDLGTTTTVDGAEESRWETNRVITDKAEQERASKARSLARSAVQSVCAQSAFGLLCPEAKRDALDSAVATARSIVDEFNSEASVTRVAFNVLCGRIAPDDAEAIRAINAEMSDLMAAMAEGMRNLDVTVIRANANRMKAVGQMLSPEMQQKVQAAIDIARKTARDAVKAAETGAQEVDRAAIAKVMESRTMFLDIGEAAPIGEVEHTGRGVDLSAEDQAYNEENRKRGEEIERQNERYYNPPDAAPTYPDDIAGDEPDEIAAPDMQPRLFDL